MHANDAIGTEQNVML